MQSETVRAQFYQLQQRGQFLSSAGLDGALFALEREPAPGWPRHELYALWACRGEGCSVDEVTVRASWPDGDAPSRPVLHCPCCGRPLELVSHLRGLVLVPAEAD